MANGWVSQDYLAPGWVSDRWIHAQAVTVNPGAWANNGYISKRWVSQTWVHYYTVVAGATVSVGNVPGLALAALPGSALQKTQVNATTTSLALGKFNAVANAGHIIAQTNVPNLALGKFNCTVNAGIYQLADITFTIEVNSTFGYTKAVTQQNVPGLALVAVDAIITTGADVNVAADKTSLALGVLPTSVKANSSTRAVTSIPLPLGVFGCTIVTGKIIAVENVPGLALAAIQASASGTSNFPTEVTATVTHLPLVAYNASLSLPGQGKIDVIRVRPHKREIRVKRRKRTFAA